MRSQFVLVNDHIINLDRIAYALWERQTLAVHFIGGACVEFSGYAAALLWQEIERRQDGECD